MCQRTSFIIFFAFAMIFSNQAVADQDPKGHAHKTPHGGLVQEAEGMHAEFLIDKSGEPKFYLYDKAMKPVDRGDLGAKLTVKGHGGEQHARELKFSKDPQDGPLFKGEPRGNPVSMVWRGLYLGILAWVGGWYIAWMHNASLIAGAK